jgi:hypothetical protein
MSVVGMPKLSVHAWLLTSVAVHMISITVVSMSARGNWDGWIACMHPPVGPEATRGSAASPRLPKPWIAPAVLAAADVGEPTRGS